MPLVILKWKNRLEKCAESASYVHAEFLQPYFSLFMKLTNEVPITDKTLTDSIQSMYECCCNIKSFVPAVYSQIFTNKFTFDMADQQDDSIMKEVVHWLLYADHAAFS